MVQAAGVKDENEKVIEKVHVPPIKTQGIKTKLVPWISHCASLDAQTVWVEPFMGSGVVGFNLAPRRAVFSDTNVHLIDFYRAIQDGELTTDSCRSFLESEGARLKSRGGDYYYEVRDRFNESHDPYDFLFLNRSCFNGLMRFNRQHRYNVPYGHNDNRFSKAYVTKIVNQLDYVQKRIADNDWTFQVAPYEDAIAAAPGNSFIYCDPPYIGLTSTYYDSWDDEKETRLHDSLMDSGCKFMVSSWHHNDYRSNGSIDTLWSDCHRTFADHAYIVNGKHKPVVEVLLTNYAVK